MAKNIVTIKFFISVDIDNYHNNFQIFISFKFKGRFLLLSENDKKQTVNYGFKLLLTIRTWKTLHIFEFFTFFLSFFAKINIIIEKCLKFYIVSNHETGLHRLQY